MSTLQQEAQVIVGYAYTLANNMLRCGLIAACDAPADDDGVIEFTPANNAFAANAVQQVLASDEADAVRCELMRRGFYVSIARRAAAQLPPLNGHAYSILVIEDDAILVRMYSKLL